MHIADTKSKARIEESITLVIGHGEVQLWLYFSKYLQLHSVSIIGISMIIYTLFTTKLIFSVNHHIIVNPMN